MASAAVTAPTVPKLPCLKSACLIDTTGPVKPTDATQSTASYRSITGPVPSIGSIVDTELAKLEQFIQTMFVHAD